MASQVRPGLTQPDRPRGPQQSAPLIRRQPAYSIRARDFLSQTQAGCMAAISSCETKADKEALGNVGASMYGPITAPRLATLPSMRRTDSPLSVIHHWIGGVGRSRRRGCVSKTSRLPAVRRTPAVRGSALRGERGIGRIPEACSIPAARRTSGVRRQPGIRPILLLSSICSGTFAGGRNVECSARLQEVLSSLYLVRGIAVNRKQIAAVFYVSLVAFRFILRNTHSD
jgi:hypothetical protein